MKLAYLILAHKNPEQLKRLIRVLNVPGCFFFIHIDKKSDLRAFEKELNTLHFSNIQLIQYRNVRWGSISQTEARIALLRMALSSNEKYTHFVMLSGQTYPIRSISDFLNLLQDQPETTFMEHHAIPYDGLINKGLDRIECYAYTIFGRRVTYLPKSYFKTFNFKGKLLNAVLSMVHFLTKKRRFPEYISAYYGIDWWVLTKQAADYIMDFIYVHPDYHKYHRYTKNTSEIYFPSILAGTDYPGKIVNDSLNYMEWLQDDSGHPKILGIEDVDKLKNSGMYFARKFDANVDSEIFDYLDENVLNYHLPEKSLICINTCNRLNEVRKFIFSYIDYCNRNRDFDFLLALDGYNTEYLEFCKTYEIPLIWSEEREGVGISKNRVLDKFPEYDYYFFIEDDVELLNNEIFADFIRIYKEKGYHHMSCSSPRKLIKTEEYGKFTIHFSEYGGAFFNFFTGACLNKVGGWHPDFAKFRRYGHTEHTYRVYNTGLNEAPFISVEELRKYIILFFPPHVTNTEIETTENELIIEEQSLIEQKLTYYPVSVLSEYQFLDFSMKFNNVVSKFLNKNRKHYPLTYGRERRHTLAEYYFERSLREKKRSKKIKYFLFSVLFNPLNIPLKHYIKVRLKKYL